MTSDTTPQATQHIPAQGTSPEGLPKPDTSEMIRVHDVFRDTLSAAKSLVGDATDDAQRVALIGNFYANILDFLAVHHEGEDELLYPLLVERCPDAAFVSRVGDQHHDVEDLIAASRSALAVWTPGDDASGSAFAESLTALGARLEEHLDDEEREILPLCEEHITMPEWGALPAHGMMHFGGDKIWLVLGLLRERMTQEQRDLQLAHMPPPAVEMWTGFGENAFNELMTQVGAPLR
jgi:hemerythrin-like domain-containing protein